MNTDDDYGFYEYQSTLEDNITGIEDNKRDDALFFFR